jgi:hypothetical protein
MKTLRYSVPGGQGLVGGQGFAGGALAQHAVTTGAALEVDFLGLFELGLGHRRCLGVDVLVHVHLAQRRIAGLVLHFGGGDARLGALLRNGDERQAHAQRQQSSQCCRTAEQSHDLPLYVFDI